MYFVGTGVPRGSLGCCLPLLPCSLSTGNQTDAPHNFAAVGHDGFYDSHGASGPVKNAALSTLGLISLAMSPMSSSQEVDGYQDLYVRSSPVERPELTAPRLSDLEGVRAQGGNH